MTVEVSRLWYAVMSALASAWMFGQMGEYPESVWFWLYGITAAGFALSGLFHAVVFLAALAARLTQK